MSDEQRRGDEIDVESHTRRVGENEEPAEEGESDVEAHVSRSLNIRMDSPSNS